MRCVNCNMDIEDHSLFCIHCGAQVPSIQPNIQRAAYSAPSAASLVGKDPSGSALVWGLVSLLTSGLLIPGIVFACIGLEYVIKAAKIGAYNGMAKAGKVLSIIALFISGISVAFWIYIIWVIYAFSSVPEGFVF